MALLGAHVSTTGGLEKAVERGVEIGCEAIQVFTSNQMQWHQRVLKPGEITAFRETRQALGFGMPVMSHGSYLLNLGSPDEAKLEQSRQAFLSEMVRCEQLGIDYLVFHPGSHLNRIPLDDCLDRVTESLNRAMRQHSLSHTMILIENTAGQGSNVGSRFEEIAAIMARLDFPEHVGVCFDTCHALAAGYDLATLQGYQQVMETFDRVIGLKHLKAFHLNDAKKPLGSRLDRHEDIGHGYIDMDTFAALVHDPRFVNTPMVLETPASFLSYGDTLQLLRSL